MVQETAVHAQSGAPTRAGKPVSPAGRHPAVFPARIIISKTVPLNFENPGLSQSGPNRRSCRVQRDVTYTKQRASAQSTRHFFETTIIGGRGLCAFLERLEMSFEGGRILTLSLKLCLQFLNKEFEPHDFASQFLHLGPGAGSRGRGPRRHSGGRLAGAHRSRCDDRLTSHRLC